MCFSNKRKRAVPYYCASFFPHLLSSAAERVCVRTRVQCTARATRFLRYRVSVYRVAFAAAFAERQRHSLFARSIYSVNYIYLPALSPPSGAPPSSPRALESAPIALLSSFSLPLLPLPFCRLSYRSRNFVFSARARALFAVSPYIASRGKLRTGRLALSKVSSICLKLGVKFSIRTTFFARASIPSGEK